MTDSWKKTVSEAPTKWLLDQIRMTNILIHESEQLLRGAPDGEARGLRQSILHSRADVQTMREEIRRLELEGK